MKKIIALAVAFTLVSGSSIAVYAEDQKSVQVVVEQRAVAASSDSSEVVKNTKVSKDKAKELAIKAIKDYLGYKIEEKKFEIRAELRQDYEFPNTYLWDISYNQNSNEKSEYYNVSIDADLGTVLGLNRNEYNYKQNQNQIAKITREQAKKLADEFVKKHFGDKENQLKYMDDSIVNYSVNYGYVPTEYNYRYIRVVNGLEFDRNYIMINVNAVDSKVSSLNMRWNSSMDFPAANNVISKDKAFETFKEKVKLVPAYMANRKVGYEEMPNSIKLTYAPDFSAGYIVDAVTGKLLDYNGKEEGEVKIKDLTDEQKKAFLQKAKASSAATKEIDETRATTVMKQYLKKLYDEDYDIESVSYSDAGRFWESAGKKVWRGQFAKKGEIVGYGPGDRGDIVIDALTESIISVYKYEYSPITEENFEPKLTWDEAYGKAIDMLAEYFPDKINAIKTEQRYSENIEYYNNKRIVGRNIYFTFPRIVNGVSDNNSSITVRIDAKTGKATELRCMWLDSLEYPSLKGAISEEEASKIYFDGHKAELIYTAISNDDGKGNIKVTINTVYRLKPTMNLANPYMGISAVEAFTGKFLDYNADEIKDKKDTLKEKLKGHWAEDKLNILADSGIIDLKDFELNKEITRLDAIIMLVKAKGYSPYMTEQLEDLKFTNIKKEDENYKYLQMAVKYGIIENKSEKLVGDSKLTRLQMVELFVNQTVYKKLATSGELFALPFKDCANVKSDKLGYIAVAKGLGISSGNNGNFRPNENATMAEFAISIYNALQYIRN